LNQVAEPFEQAGALGHNPFQITFTGKLEEFFSSQFHMITVQKPFTRLWRDASVLALSIV